MRNLVKVLALSAACLATAQAATSVTTSAATLHRLPSTSGRVLGTVPARTLLITACQGSWCRTTYQNTSGYVARSLTRPVTASAPLGGKGTRFYLNCARVRAAGKAPLKLGEVGYRVALDRDHNGLACEQGE